MQTVSRVYDTYSQAQAAVTAIEAAGVPAAEVSLVANKYVSEKYADVDDVSKAGAVPASVARWAAARGCWRASACWRSPASVRWLPRAGSRRLPSAPLPERQRAAWSARW